MTPDYTGGPDREIDAALDHIAAGRLTDAATICRALVAADPDHGQAWHLLGSIALHTNVHLRAAAGGASRVLVPNPAEFRWMAAGSLSPWFPDSKVYR